MVSQGLWTLLDVPGNGTPRPINTRGRGEYAFYWPQSWGLGGLQGHLGSVTPHVVFTFLPLGRNFCLEQESASSGVAGRGLRKSHL
jgi:hypothetical protein